MGTQQFCLKWNNHQSNMLTVFEQLLSTEALVDVTLACDGLSLKAHKMVLSACSPYFQSLFLENPCKHPIVIMKDMRYTELKAIIDFMYRGEVNVSHDQLNALLRTAETLKVKGLAEVSGENRTAAGMVQQEIVQQNVTTSPATGPPPQTRSDSPTLLSKRKRGRPRKRSLSDSNRSDDEQVPSKIKEPGSPEIEELSGDASIEANDISLSSNSQTQVHQSLPSSSVHNSHLNKHPSSIQSSHDSQVEEPPSDDGDFEVEPSKLMEQTLTTDVPVMSNSTPQSTVAPSVHIVPLSSSSGLDVNTRSIVPSGSESTTLVPASASIASDSLSSSQMQGPDSPQDIKPALLSFEEPPISPVAGPSQDRSMMMYMDTSGVPAIPGTSYQDNQTAIVQHESQPQDFSGSQSNCDKAVNSVKMLPPDQTGCLDFESPSSDASNIFVSHTEGNVDCYTNNISLHSCSSESSVTNSSVTVITIPASDKEDCDGSVQRNMFKEECSQDSDKAVSSVEIFPPEQNDCSPNAILASPPPDAGNFFVSFEVIPTVKPELCADCISDNVDTCTHDESLHSRNSDGSVANSNTYQHFQSLSAENNVIVMTIPTSDEEDFDDSLENVCNEESDCHPDNALDSNNLENLIPSGQMSTENEIFAHAQDNRNPVILSKKLPHGYQFYCPFCDYFSKYKSSVILHLRQHTGEKPYVCDYCQKAFAHKANFCVHIKKHSAKLKLFKCSSCQKYFASKSLLSAHLRDFHRVKPYKCSICRKGFSRENGLKFHFKLHSTAEKRVKCPHCYKEYSYQKTLEKHLKSHTELSG